MKNRFVGFSTLQRYRGLIQPLHACTTSGSYADPSPGFSSRGGQKPKGGAKNKKGGEHLQNTVLDACSNKGTKREMGGHRFQMGGRAPLAPPLATALFLCNQTLQRFQRFSSCGYSSDRRSGAIKFVILRSTFPLFGIVGDFGLIPR